MGIHNLRCYGMNRFQDREALTNLPLKEVKHCLKMIHRSTLPSHTSIRYTLLTEEKKT